MAYALPLFLFSFLASLFGVRAAIGFLQRRNILDNPNERSSHDVATPRGAGLALIPILVVGLVLVLVTQPVAWPSRAVWMATMVGLIAIAGVSWLDDLRATGLRRRVRFIVQILAVSLPMFFWPTEWGTLFPGVLPVWIERIVIALAWLWFVNLYNFMDGINGLSGVETLCIGLGLVILHVVTSGDAMSGIPQTACLLSGAALGFLFWNARPNAKIFLGDSGSIGLGYLVGWVLIVLASTGYVLEAFILPLVYLVDATVTLFKRALQRKKIWDPHREHFYQQVTVRGGFSHLKTVSLIAAVNIALVVLVVMMASNTLGASWGLLAGIALVSALMSYFRVKGKRAA